MLADLCCSSPWVQFELLGRLGHREAAAGVSPTQRRIEQGHLPSLAMCSL